jgi:hypothetical protein
MDYGHHDPIHSHRVNSFQAVERAPQFPCDDDDNPYTCPCLVPARRIKVHHTRSLFLHLLNLCAILCTLRALMTGRAVEITLCLMEELGEDLHFRIPQPQKDNEVND